MKIFSIAVEMKQEVKQSVAAMSAHLLKVRHHLHARPELSFQEKETAAYLSNLLTEWGISHKNNVGGYGIVGLIEGKNPAKKTIALRADMDALALTEQNHLPYKSLNSGVMHACGHDVHMTCLLGTVKILNDLKNNFEGTVKFIFQPAEEELPGGALQMIKEGVLENPKPDAIFAQHVFPELQAGQVGFKTGKYMASSDELSLFVKGKGGHAAIPEKRDNTVLAAAQVLLSLENVLTKNKPADLLSVLAFGRFIADGTYNIIPSGVQLRGTFRTFDESWREQAHRLIKKTADKIALEYGVSCEVTIRKGYPVLVNDEKLTQNAREAAIEFLGKENVKGLEIRMTVEDFARYGQIIPACFYRLGTGNRAKGITANLHTSTFDVDEKSIATGTGLMVWMALKNLSI
ncbi:MAG: M20 family metallopeptidase [Bacteroidales bacterium]|nr:M20 family metallopeptidase [Bacteroidales bacterium]MCF6342589.1 M20 family metallopeptidase [Bacteroidales bacterium]